MAKLNWLNKAIKTQHGRFQNDYAGDMGARFRKFQREQLEEQERIRLEALSEEEQIERRIRAEMLLNGGCNMPIDPNWLGVMP